MQNSLALRMAAVLTFVLGGHLHSQDNSAVDKFRQLQTQLRTPNVYRTASGAPGHMYWQQKADYDIRIDLDDDNQRISGSETVTYHNNSPDALAYLWLQLDQNIRRPDADAITTATSSIPEKMTFKDLSRLHYDFEGGFHIEAVDDLRGSALPHVINKTMMRVDLPQELRPGSSLSFRVRWWYHINDRLKLRGRSGYEYFPEDDNYIYTIAQFYPRMAVYNEVEGWQHKQYLGAGEFALPFGDFKVAITVPADHVVAATGQLENPTEMLTSKQRARLQQAHTSSEPVFIIPEDEARNNEQSRTSDRKTWIFKARQVRDFAFASSRKFMWDGMGVNIGGKTVMAMSLYPKEGNPLWQQYATKAIAHTLRCYSRYTFDYPYPVAWAIHTDQIGMEYPMISFDGRRPEKDGTYSATTKYRLISVIIHEVGHNFFPMIVNSDERQWTWMDEGLNSFMQFLTEQEWQHDYPSRRGKPEQIVDYMKGDKKRLAPIMTNSESLLQKGNNAYAKTATALNILRETILGRELFDYAFKRYARLWMFKHPTPDDFFRTIEDASGVDLDWFWRGWFFSTDFVDLAIDDVKWYQVDTRDPAIEKPVQKHTDEEQPKYIADVRNKTTETRVEKDESLLDFYNKFDPYEVSFLDEEEYRAYLERLSGEDKQLLESGYHYYQVHFSNNGGLVMPLILAFTYEDDSTEIKRIPVEIWRYNAEEVSKVFASTRKIKSITLDPYLETADVDMSNNYWPPKIQPTRFQLFKERSEGENLMQRAERGKRLLQERSESKEPESESREK